MADVSTKTVGRRLALCVVSAVAALLLLAGLPAARLRAANLDEMSLERWAQLREAERYQLNIAEKYYREQNWKVAQAEYEKYLRLYETSEAAPYAQLKWSLCLRPLRLQNTAIKEGFQSVIDYWPESAEAVAAAYYIGETYLQIGDMPKAKKAFAAVFAAHPDHFVATLSRADLCKIALTEKDEKKLAALWKELALDVKRTPENTAICRDAAHLLTNHYLLQGNYGEAKKVLESNYPEKDDKGNPVPGAAAQLAGALAAQAVGEFHLYPFDRRLDLHVYRGNCPVRVLVEKAETKPQGEQAADQLIALLKQVMPADVKVLDPANPDPKIVENAKLARQFWYSIADAHDAAQRFDEVPKTYSQMEGVLGVDDEMLGRLAGWWIGQQKYEQATATYGRFKDTIAGRAAVATMLRENQQQYDAAATMFKNLAVEDKERLGQWLSQAAIAYDHNHGKKLEECINIYQQLIKDDTAKAADWQWAIAWTYHNFGQYKEAIATYRLTDRFPESYQRMAECHRALQQWSEAILLYNQIQGSHPPLADWAAYMAADTWRAADKKQSAIKAYQLVCDKFPKSGYAAQSHAILQSDYKINYIGGGGKEAVEE
jgi:tetratricopeptide (TPR) repeat protein